MKIETKMFLLTKGVISPPERDQFHFPRLIVKEATRLGEEGWWIASVLQTENGLAVVFQREVAS